MKNQTFNRTKPSYRIYLEIKPNHYGECDINFDDEDRYIHDCDGVFWIANCNSIKDVKECIKAFNDRHEFEEEYAESKFIVREIRIVKFN